MLLTKKKNQLICKLHASHFLYDKIWMVKEKIITCCLWFACKSRSKFYISVLTIIIWLSDYKTRVTFLGTKTLLATPLKKTHLARPRSRQQPQMSKVWFACQNSKIFMRALETLLSESLPQGKAGGSWTSWHCPSRSSTRCQCQWLRWWDRRSHKFWNEDNGKCSLLHI